MALYQNGTMPFIIIVEICPQYDKIKKNESEDEDLIDKEKLKQFPKIILYCAIMIVIWPIGAFLMLRDKQIDRQLRILESVCCFVLWILVVGGTISRINNGVGEDSQTIQIAENNDTIAENDIKEPDETEKTDLASQNNAEPKLPDGFNVAAEAEQKADDTLEKPEKSKKKNQEKTSHREGMFGISNKDVDDIDGTFSRNKVRNDTTGNWRISTIAANIQMVDYALSYYEWYMLDDEIHFIVNFNYNTTTCIQYMNGCIFVTVHEYVDGEEHDANLLGGGMVLAQYIVYPDNGDIEEIQ